ncbi:MAG: hypothetical protein HY901_12330 [Deltaproteobacteria bacterium]|nr:hypothetical protein [Deltaproteobacteria bacterium]
MRKAFDANVSRTKPRLRLGALTTAVVDPAQDVLGSPAYEARDMVEHATAQANEMEPATVVTVQEKIAAHLAQSEEAPAATVATPARTVTAVAAPVVAAQAPVRVEVVEAVAVAEAMIAPTPTSAPVARAATPMVPKATAPILDSRERREKLRERLKAATARVEPSAPTPQSPAEARTSALALVAQLRQQLEDAQKLNVALSKDLDVARADLARAAEEARARTGEATRMAGEVAERARLIDELGKEMASLEAERDDTLVQLQSARVHVEQQAAVHKVLEDKLVAREAELADTLTEEERLAAELESRNAELRQTQSALAGITEERDALARQVTDLTRERTDLLDSQKALDEIHRALAEARVRIGAKA